MADIEKIAPPGPGGATAERFTALMERLRDDEELAKIRRYFKPIEGQPADIFIGVRPGQLFEMAKAYIDMPPDEIEILLTSPIHDARAGALSIMAKQAARKATPAARRQALFELYLKRLDHIDNWDLVDLAAREVVGAWLWDRPRDLLYELAASPNMWARRIAIYSTAHFIQKGQRDDTWAVAKLLVNEPEDLVQKATGGVLRWAGVKDRAGLVAFLDAHAAVMPRTMLRYAVERLEPELRAHYLGLRGKV